MTLNHRRGNSIVDSRNETTRPQESRRQKSNHRLAARPTSSLQVTYSRGGRGVSDDVTWRWPCRNRVRHNPGAENGGSRLCRAQSAELPKWCRGWSARVTVGCLPPFQISPARVITGSRLVTVNVL